MEVKDLTPAQCILLTVHLASESNLKALHSFTPTRADALDTELVLRILLTYLPESLEPREYLNYVQEVASHLYLDVDREDVSVDTSPVRDISDEEAHKRVKQLRLLKIVPPNFPKHAPDDLLTRFVCHRATRIDSETGMLHLLPPLVEPFLQRNPFIRTWYISVVLPILRFSLEYYPESEPMVSSIGAFEDVDGKSGIEMLLKEAGQAPPEVAKENIVRDIRGLVGPWMYGHTERHRKHHPQQVQQDDAVDEIERGFQKIALTGVTEEDKTGHDWEYVFDWLVRLAVTQLETVATAIEGWDGPADIDLGDYERRGLQYLDEDVQPKLEQQYAQAAFAACYAAEADSEDTVQQAHAILARLAMLLDFVPPPDLATSVESLPRVDDHLQKLEHDHGSTLTVDTLLTPEHPFTTPRLESYMHLQMVVYSAYQLSGLGQPCSLARVAKLHAMGTEEDQLDLFRKILKGLVKADTSKDDGRWTADRARLLWLWNWGIEPDATNSDRGHGVLGKIAKDTFEAEMLKVFVTSSGYSYATKFYIIDEKKVLPASRVEKIIIDEVMAAYDSASNGNKTRGGVKKANEIINAFRSHFPNSILFQQATALIAATHALSFYSLTLQHGVPFQPVSIRVSQDPIALIDKVLEQNPRSYAKLDDLVAIAQNLESSGLVHRETDQDGAEAVDDLATRRKQAGRRVTFMSIEAALREDDFETAYSYIVNRLTPSGVDVKAPGPDAAADDRRRSQGHVKRPSQARVAIEDDISWRAAFLAGRYRPSSSTQPSLRRLEQRTELLSLALLLAPTSALTEILAAWRRCEEEMTTLQQAQDAAEQEFDDHAAKRSTGVVPGNFTLGNEQPALVLNQKRREVGRMSAADREDETPLSMFDLTRNAARAFSSNAFPLRTSATSASMDREASMSDHGEPASPTQDSQRMRKRDMVASAVGGGLASGLGWVLGATPNHQRQQSQLGD